MGSVAVLLVRVAHGPLDMSVRDHFRDAGPDLSDRRQFRDAVLAELRRHPDLVDAWHNYAGDMR